MVDLLDWIAATHREVRRSGNGNAGSVLLRRRYEAAVDDVWDACTSPARLARWFGGVRGEPVLGGTVLVEIGEGAPLTCEVLECEAPRLLVVTWQYGDKAADRVALRLEAEGAATVLELEHFSAEAATWAASGGAGWEDWLYRLSVALDGGDGRAVSSEEIQPPLAVRWAAVIRARP